ncbi:hypothetical protein EG856_03555 [Mycoplasmopsis phocirhinis]|uniref:Uncharacterized protein n=1 Tax=Mycoplasmopsis phocirhinis TaxID=142650 RepID=A0A4P6MTD2_9BACT|nr:hypothetical protein [Mycoplasmopsis phocirhinis]QBF34964.1 hypothetical protein EG856_03555 [Mycoplasmopsis phocirhinis]
MNKDKNILLNTEYLTRLEQNEIYKAILNYDSKLSAIVQATKKQTISQTDYFRIKSNFNQVEDLIDDLLTISRFNYLEEVKSLYASIVNNFNLLFTKYVIDYTASDSPDTRAYHKLDTEQQFSLTSYLTSFVIVEDKFVIFVAVDKYQYPILTEFVCSETDFSCPADCEKSCCLVQVQAVENSDMAETQNITEEDYSCPTDCEKTCCVTEVQAVENSDIETNTNENETTPVEFIEETKINEENLILDHSDVLTQTEFNQYLDLAHYTSLPEKDLLDALTKYSHKLEKINTNFKRQTVSQADYFRTKQNLNDVQELVDDLLTHDSYSYKQETQLVYDDVNRNFDNILNNLVIDYTAADTPDNNGLALLNINENDFLNYQTSFILHENKQVVFNVANEYSYPILSVQNLETNSIEDSSEHEQHLMNEMLVENSVVEPIMVDEEVIEHQDKTENNEFVEFVQSEEVQNSCNKEECETNCECASECDITVHETQTFVVDSNKKLKPSRYLSKPKKFWWILSLVVVSLILVVLLILVGLRAYEIINNIDIF